MKKLKYSIILIPLVTVLFSCASTAGNGAIESIFRGTGSVLGTVTASASVTENRKTGKVTGDAKKYGYIITKGSDDNKQLKRLAANSLTNATDTAYANALYEIIQQAKKKGGDALNEVVSTNKRNFDQASNNETVTVTITATIVKTK